MVRPPLFVGGASECNPLFLPRPLNRFRVPGTGFRLEQEVAAYERRWVEAALNQASGVKSQAAKLLGINKDKMKYLCRKYEL